MLDFEQAVDRKRFETPHYEFYDTLIEKMGGLDAVCHCCPMGKEEIKRALEENRNLDTTPIKIWQLAAGWTGCDDQSYDRWKPIQSPLRAKLREIGVRSYSVAEGVCLAKRIAMRMAMESTKKVMA